MPTRFVDKYLSDRIEGYPVDVSPMFSTQIAEVASGSEQANQLWLDPKRDINIPQGARDWPTVEALKKHFYVMAGPAHTWPWRDPTDFASVDLLLPNEVPVTSDTDQRIGVGDGTTTAFQIYKTYSIGSPATDYVRPIYLPVLSSVEIAIDGVPLADVSPAMTATVSRPGGVIEFSYAPGAGQIITAGYLFDVIVRYEADDTLRNIMRTVGVGGFADIPLKEVRYCED